MFPTNQMAPDPGLASCEHSCNTYIVPSNHTRNVRQKPSKKNEFWACSEANSPSCFILNLWSSFSESPSLPSLYTLSPTVLLGFLSSSNFSHLVRKNSCTITSMHPCASLCSCWGMCHLLLIPHPQLLQKKGGRAAQSHVSMCPKPPSLLNSKENFWFYF